MRLSTRGRAPWPMPSAFVGFRFPAEVIVVAIRWYLRYTCPYQPVGRCDEMTRHAPYSLAMAAECNRPLVTLAGVAHPPGLREAAIAFSRVHPERVPGTATPPAQLVVRRRRATPATFVSIQP